MGFPLVYKSDKRYVRNKNIIEFDMKSGGYSIAISKGLIEDKKTRLKLKHADKKEKQIILGLYAKEHKEFTKSLHKGFQEYIKLFIEENDIETKSIITINKDSVLFFGRQPRNVSFDKVLFTKRGSFTSYLKLGRIEFLLNGKTGEKLIKGIAIDDYTETLLEEVFTVMKMAEFGGKKSVIDYLIELRQAYVNLDLTDNYYKELSPLGRGYLLKEGYKFNNVYINEMDDEMDISDIDIAYNYKNFIIPLCDIFV